MGLRRTDVVGEPYAFTQDNTGKANAVVGIYTTLPAVERFLIGALVLTLSPARLHVAIDTTGNNIADTWVAVTGALTATAQPGEHDAS